MKKVFFISLFIYLTLFSFSFSEEKPKELIFAYEDAEAFPWVLNGKKGLDIELIKILEKKINIKIKLEKYPWKRCLLMLKTNQVDGIFASSFKEDRAEMGAYPYNKNNKDDETKRIHTSEYSVYIRKNSDVKWDGKQFKNLKRPVGTQSGFSIIDKLKKMGLEVDDGVKGVEENLKKLIYPKIFGMKLKKLETQKSIRRK